MRLGRPYLVVLLGTLMLALLWQVVPRLTAAVDQRQEQRRLEAEQLLIALSPPEGFDRSKCSVQAASVCMTGEKSPEESVDRVIALLAPHADAIHHRCKQLGPPQTPRDCTVLADVNGVMVSALLFSRLMPDPPLRFQGSDLWLSAVEGRYRPATYFANEDFATRP